MRFARGDVTGTLLSRRIEVHGDEPTRCAIRRPAIAPNDESGFSPQAWLQFQALVSTDCTISRVNHTAGGARRSVKNCFLLARSLAKADCPVRVNATSASETSAAKTT